MTTPRRKTQLEFMSEMAEVLPNVRVLGEYKNDRTPIECECKVCGHRWSAQPRSMTRTGSGCRKCAMIAKRISESEFVEKLALANPTIELCDGYVMGTEKATFRCKTCGNIWETIPIQLLTRTGCPVCGIAKRARHRRKTHDQFVSEMATRLPDVEVVGTYERSDAPILFRCKKCGAEWTTTPARALISKGCRVCRHPRRKPRDEVYANIKRLNPTVTPIGEYKGVSRKMTFRCNLCGKEWDITPAQVLRGTGCSSCCHVQTSFFENVLLHVLRQVFGNDNVLSRDVETIGSEIDIIIPSRSLAFEPGAWFFHKDILENDKRKLDLCRQHEIKLVVLYFACKDDSDVPSWAVSTDSPLDSPHWDSTIIFIEDLLQRYDISYDNIDWESARVFAIENSRRRTTKEFCEKLADINPNIRVLDEYTVSKEKIYVECRVCGHEWSAKPDNLLSGRGCPKCGHRRSSLANRKSHEDFVKEVGVRNPTLEILGKYVRSSDKILVRCRKCGREWESRAYNIYSGKACPNCSRTKSHEAFVQSLEKVSPNIEVTGRYVGNRVPIDVRCKRCGHTWAATPNRLMTGDGCQKCAWKDNGEKMRLSHEEFLERLTKVSTTIEPLQPYVTTFTSIDFRCKECGNVWKAKPCNILSGKGCPKCMHEKNNRLLMERGYARFLERMAKLHPEIEIVGEYTGNKNNIEVRCKKCGHTWSATPGNLPRSKGCPECRKSKAA